MYPYVDTYRFSLRHVDLWWISQLHDPGAVFNAKCSSNILFTALTMSSPVAFFLDDMNLVMPMRTTISINSNLEGRGTREGDDSMYWR